MGCMYTDCTNPVRYHRNEVKNKKGKVLLRAEDFCEPHTPPWRRDEYVDLSKPKETHADDGGVRAGEATVGRADVAPPAADGDAKGTKAAGRPQPGRARTRKGDQAGGKADVDW